MGKTEIRTVCKVSFDKHASEQPQLHVSQSMICTIYAVLTDTRIDGILTVSNL